MKVIKVSPKFFSANGYIVTADNVNAVVFDYPSERVPEKAKSLALNIKAIFLTHCHFDHVEGFYGGIPNGAEVYCLDKERDLIGTDAELFGMIRKPRPDYTPTKTVSNGETVEYYGLKITAISTPGHTKGSCTYLVCDEKTGEKVLFTGDTLFMNCIGRTDFPTGNASEILASIEKLANLEGDYPVYAGHEDDTTLENERKNNPYMPQGRR